MPSSRFRLFPVGWALPTIKRLQTQFPQIPLLCKEGLGEVETPKRKPLPKWARSTRQNRLSPIPQIPLLCKEGLGEVETPKRKPLPKWALPTMYFMLPLLLFFSPAPGFSQETDQDVPVGAVGGSVHADLFTGTATTSIPIEVPPGRGGVQPELALVYGSANGNGWSGMGWKLEKGVIERQTKHGVDYSGDDYVFRLSGINVELVNVGTDEYRAKIEGGFTKVEKLTAIDGKPYFMATDKTGKKFYFGQEANTRVADPNDANNIFRWCLDRVEDTNGNYMTLSYTGDQGQSYQARVDYTGHGITAPNNSVIFHLEDRPDVTPMYVPNFEMTTAKRLKTIEIQANGNIIRAYTLTYTTSISTNRSLLKDVTQFGSDATIDSSGSITAGTSLPSMTLNWQGDPEGTFTRAHRQQDYPNDGPIWKTGGDEYPIYIGDFNGDGKADVLQAMRDSYQAQVALSNGDGTFIRAHRQQDYPNDGPIWKTSGNEYPIYIGDFNGDGKADVFQAMRDSHQAQVALSNGDGTWFLVISCGIEEETYRRCDHVNHGHKGLGVSIASCS